VDSVRRALREQRQALDGASRDQVADAVAGLATPLLAGAASLAAYVAVQGEVDPAPIVHAAWARGLDVFLPRVMVGRSMVFAAWHAGAPTVRGHYGVPEPTAEVAVRPAGRLDVVLVPLVAFDRTGTRLGTGAGFYDRAFAFKHGQPRGSRPLLVGLAYAFQEVPGLERRSWDVPLDYVVTERELIRAGPLRCRDRP
jgi:5-formyltetrahydrofolate cyclo-ligase